MINAALLNALFGGARSSELRGLVAILGLVMTLPFVVMQHRAADLYHYCRKELKRLEGEGPEFPTRQYRDWPLVSIGAQAATSAAQSRPGVGTHAPLLILNETAATLLLHIGFAGVWWLLLASVVPADVYQGLLTGVIVVAYWALVPLHGRALGPPGSECDVP